ncbi:response regulator [Magnetococcales bacterium HHB-1]
MDDVVHTEMINLLLVEDSQSDAAIFRRYLNKGLSNHPHVLTIADNFSEGLKQILGQTFDLCFLDFNLGKKTGLDLFQEARKQGIKIPIIFLTGVGDEETAVTVMKSGATDYLSKESLSAESLSRSMFHALELANSEKRRHAAEAALFEKSAHLDNVLYSATDLAIITTDQDLKIKYFNPMAADLFNISKNKVIGQTVTDIQWKFGVDPKRFQLAMKSVTDIGEHRFEIQLEKDDGLHFLDCRFSSVIDKNSQLSGYCLTIRDVTERKRLLQNLELAVQQADAANRAKSAFLASMSHDIRTPLNTIIGVSDLLSSAKLDAENQQYVRILKQSGESLLALLNDILDFSKIEAEQIQLEDIAFDFRELVVSTTEILRLPAEDKGLHLTANIADNIAQYVRGDPDRLRQILLNIIGNSIKFTQTGSVCLQVSQGKKNKILFVISDTGIGIEKDRLDHIFHPFTQSDTSTTRRFGGTGLGLSICKQLSEKMGGSIYVESSPGKGSSFHVSIPLPATDDQIRHDSQHDVTEKQNARKLHKHKLSILLADDAEDNHLLVAAFLKQTPHTIDFASNGQECVDKFKQGNYDLVLMDIQMPIMDGFEATKNIRSWEKSNGRNPAIIIALTAHATKEIADTTLQSGCDLHATKPITKKRLVNIINSCTSL